MNNKSIWNDYRDNYNKIDNPNLENRQCDILIIGGGITGISTAYFLKDSNYNTILIDKGKIGEGITARTTAKITYLQGIIYQTLEKKFGYNKAYDYYQSQKEAIKIIKDIIKKEAISCDFERCDSVIFTLENKGIKKITKEKELLNNYGSKVYDINNDKCLKGIKIKDSYMFNPLKFIDKIKEIIKNKIKIYENIMAQKIIYKDGQYIVKTNKGNIYSKRIVIACHYPFFLIPGLYPVKTYIKREYVNSAKLNSNNKYMAISIDKELHSLRFYKDYLIYGSCQQRLTNQIDYKNNYDKSTLLFEKYFHTKPIYTWMNQDIMSNDYLPFIGKIKDNFYISLGYNAWGMTNGILGGKIISDLIIHKNNKYTNLFNPRRVNLVLIINSFIGIFHYLKGYILGLFKKSNPQYVKIDGLLYGIYTDKSGKKHIVKLICPHMKCPLVFNRKENTWDCPCHGSRFDIDGKVIFGPSCKTINIIDKEKD